MKIVGKNDAILAMIPDAIKNAWPNTTLVLDPYATLPPDTDKKKCIAITDKVESKNIIKIVESTGIYHLIQVSSPEFVREINAAATMIEKPLTFLDDPIGVVLQTYEEGGTGAKDKTNAPTGDQVVNRRFKYNFNSSMEKKPALDSLRMYIEKVPRSRTIQNDAMVIADELFTNAVFNAPNKGAEVSRTISVHLEAKRPPNVFAFFNNDRFLIGVEDPYGSLMPEKAIERIKGCYEKGVTSSIRMGTGGAGIGLFMVFDMSVSFYVCIDQNVRTIVCAALPLGVSGRAKEGMLKNCHMQIKKK